jgi:hypothetical protein
MDFVFGFLIGLFIGGAVFYVTYKNNKTKMDAIAKIIETELVESAIVKQIKEVFAKKG